MMALMLFALGTNTSSVLAEDPPRLPVTHQHFNSVEGVLTQEGMAP